MVDPGNVNKGFCLKCKIPLLVDLPDENRIRLLCVDCTREVKERLKHTKNNPNLKRIVIHADTYKVKKP